MVLPLEPFVRRQIAFDLKTTEPLTMSGRKPAHGYDPTQPERKAQLESTPSGAAKTLLRPLDDALAIYLEWERQDFVEVSRAFVAATRM